MAFLPRSGTDGRVRNGSNVIAGLYEWAFPKEVRPIPIPHFEAAADAVGIVWTPHLKGLGVGRVRLRGWGNTDTLDNTQTGTPGLRDGQDVALDLYYSKAAATGYENVVGFITNFESTMNADNRAYEFTCEIILTAVPPAPGSITS